MTPITLNLDPKLIEFIKSFAKKNDITQKEVVEMSLKKQRIENIKKEIKDFFEDMTPEMEKECLWLANAGLEDYKKNLKEIDNEK